MKTSKLTFAEGRNLSVSISIYRKKIKIQEKFLDAKTNCQYIFINAFLKYIILYITKAVVEFILPKQYENIRRSKSRRQR